MRRLFFCNIGWMSRYEGLAEKPDKIVGGGRWVVENGNGGEVCNFLKADDGLVYGHVETIKVETDRKIQIKKLGGEGDSVSGIDVVWTATHPDEGGRRIVGWYRNATVFRERQDFKNAPSRQHKKDGLETYRIRTRAEDAYRLELEDRALFMPFGKGWMGQTPWWSPPQEPNEEVKKFLDQVRDALIRASFVGSKTQKGSQGTGKSPATAIAPYVRYVQEYEVEIHPRHNDLQKQFVDHLNNGNFSDVQENISSVDVRFRDAQKRLVLAEVKPCNKENARFAIRTAIGQLLDYRQRADEEAKMLVVLEVPPSIEDRALAISNGFGVAFPSENGFKIIWPDN